MAITEYGPMSWERMIGAWDNVRRRLQMSTLALTGYRIPYAVIGGNAVASWVSTIDPAAVRGTPNVDLLINRGDLAWATSAMLGMGYTQAFVGPPHCFLDGANCKPRSGIRLYFAGETVGTNGDCVLPNLSDTVQRTSKDWTHMMHIIGLHPLVEMKLSAFRRIDRVHLRDMLDVGLIDTTWTTKVDPQLAARRQELIDDPDG